MKLLFTLFLTGLLFLAHGQNPGIDVLKYHFTLKLSDRSDSIYGSAEIDWQITQVQSSYSFDLKNIRTTGGGMHVDRVTDSNGNDIPFRHSNDQLIIVPVEKSEVQKLTIEYRGIPIDGLIIGENKFGDRTFFSDNWPDRGSHYLPLNDHPLDKAKTGFTIIAPNQYTIVSNGQLKDIEVLDDSTNATTYVNPIEIPVKVMVFGAARFDQKSYDTVQSIPVKGYVFPQDSINGHLEYSKSSEILEFYIEQFGTYPFVKLDNVQSKTIFGGMENAGCIFYHENSTRGDGSSESLIAHEIVHQWFGNSATETDWKHLWLSEGFATYFTGYYLQQVHGDSTFYAYLKSNAQKVLRFRKSNPTAVVVPDSVPNAMILLNPYSYEKGGWILHMLRVEMGDDAFLKAIRQYYETYELSNASSIDFISICTENTDKNLESFFHYWLKTPRIPQVAVSITQTNAETQITLKAIDLPTDLALNHFTTQVSIHGEELVFESVLQSDKMATIKIPALVSKEDINFNVNWNYLVEIIE